MFLKRGLFSGLLAALAFSSGAMSHAYTFYSPVCQIIATFIGLAYIFGISGLFMLPGLLNLRFEVSSFKAIPLIIIGNMLFLFARSAYQVNYGGGPPLPWPDFNFFGTGYLIAALTSLYMGTIFFAGVRGRWLPRIIGPALGGITIILVAYYARRFFPCEPLVIMEYWEGITIAAGIPLMCAVSWGVLDLCRSNDAC
ncbi:MAG: hypothetical protein PHT33_08000 [bacterium]|nr:hypothetical protein [bacterium]